MRYTVASLHKALGKLIESGHARKRVCVDKQSFRHNCEDDGVTILELCGLGVKWITMSDGDGGTQLNKDGSESGSTVLILAGNAGANCKGELVDK